MGSRPLHVHTAPLAIVLATLLGSAQGTPGTPVPISMEEMLEAMRQVKGYSLTATANGARLEADVILSIIQRAAAQDPDRRPLFFGHREWYDAFLARTGLTPAQAPLYARLSYEMGQD